MRTLALLVICGFLILGTLGISLPLLEEIERLAFCNEIRAGENMDEQSNIDDGCDLSGADLSFVDLFGADLTAAPFLAKPSYRLVQLNPKQKLEKSATARHLDKVALDATDASW